MHQSGARFLCNVYKRNTGGKNQDIPPPLICCCRCFTENTAAGAAASAGRSSGTLPPEDQAGRWKIRNGTPLYIYIYKYRIY